MNKKIRFLMISAVLAAFILQVHCAFAQDLQRVRKMLDTLCAPGMHGRGYVDYGDQIAANYLQHQFQEIGLQPVKPNTWLQYFTLPINRFPDRAALQVGRKLLEPGADYLVSAASAGGEGKAKVIYLDSAGFVKAQNQNLRGLKKLEKRALVFSPAAGRLFKNAPETAEKLKPAKALIFLKNEKLTATVLGTQEAQVRFQVQERAWPKQTKRIRYAVDAELVPSYISQNVLGLLPGSAHPDSFLVFTAHYDHLGRMGRDTYFPGANDNASGISMLLEIARYYSEPAHRPEYSILFIAFGGEEAGLVGSKFFTDHPMLPLESIRFLLNLDLLGTGEVGITVVNGSVLSKEFKQLEKLNSEQKLLAQVKPRGEAANSDHYPFTSKGVRGFFIYTMGGTKAYHDIYDRSEQLSLAKYKEVFQLLTQFSGWLMKPKH